MTQPTDPRQPDRRYEAKHKAYTAVTRLALTSSQEGYMKTSKSAFHEEPTWRPYHAEPEKRGKEGVRRSPGPQASVGVTEM